MPPYPTNALLALVLPLLGAPNLLVGDGVAPRGSGWSGGQPGKGTFKPYIVVDLLAASPLDPSLRDTQASWIQPLMIAAFGGSRQQANWGLDTQRPLMSELRAQGFPDWQIQAVRYTSLGGATRDDATDPAIWRANDSVELRIVRR